MVTTSESCEALKPLADGLMQRFQAGNVAPSIILYTDRDCCSDSGDSKFNRLFNQWPSLKVRLDIWHYIRRIAVGCTSESHPLYGIFLTQLSGCIFEWDDDDFNLLLKAKKVCIQGNHQSFKECYQTCDWKRRNGTAL